MASLEVSAAKNNTQGQELQKNDIMLCVNYLAYTDLFNIIQFPRPTRPGLNHHHRHHYNSIRIQSRAVPDTSTAVSRDDKRIEIINGQPCRVLHGQGSKTLVGRLTSERASSRLVLVFISLIERPIPSINFRGLNFGTTSPS